MQNQHSTKARVLVAYLVVEIPSRHNYSRFVILGFLGKHDVQYKSCLSSYAKRIWFLADAIAPALGNTETRLEFL